MPLKGEVTLPPFVQTKKKLPPHNLEAERSVLAAMLLEVDAFHVACELLDRDDFYEKRHSSIFESMLDVSEKQKSVDIVTVSEALKKKQSNISEDGELEYLISITNALSTTANIEQHAEIIRSGALLRKLISTCTEIIQDSYETDDIQAVIDRAEAKMFSLPLAKKTTSVIALKDQIHKTFDFITDVYQNRGKTSGLPSGFRDLDLLTSGFTPSELIILAARPSMGKTAFASILMENISLLSKKTVLFFSLEMSKESLVQRMLCSYATVNAHDLKRGFLQNKGWIKLTGAAEDLSKANVFIDDTPGLDILEIKAKARRLKRKSSLDFIIIDYLQLMQSYKRTENRQQEISIISRSLKELARELKVPVLALSQLSRAVEARNNKTPMLSDLRESGAIEQDADVVFMLMREEYYNPTEENKNLAQLIVGKNRNGPTGKVDLLFRKEILRFENLSIRRGE